LHLLRLPVGDLALRVFLGHRIGFLHAAREMLALAQRAGDLLVGELRPALLGARLVIVPAAFEVAPVHDSSFAIALTCGARLKAGSSAWRVAAAPDGGFFSSRRRRSRHERSRGVLAALIGMTSASAGTAA